jgi:hypothetical protein
VNPYQDKFSFLNDPMQMLPLVILPFDVNHAQAYSLFFMSIPFMS